MMAGVLRAIRAPLVIVLVSAGAFFGVKARYGHYDDFYQLTVDLPRAGQLLRVGSDVRERGVLIGTVSDIRLVDRRARITLQIEPQYRVPEDARAVVGLKTLLGDKYVDLRFDSFGPPFLDDGATIAGDVGPELEDVLANGVRVFESIDPSDAATIVGELADGARGHGGDVARGLRANAELSTIFRETLEPQLRGLHAFHVVFDELKDRGVDLNRLADAVNEGVPVYASERAQRELRAALEALVPMSDHLADLLILDRRSWDRMLDSGDTVLQTIAERPEELHRLVHGLYRYVFKLGAPPPALPDGSEAAPFVNFITEEDEDDSSGAGRTEQSSGQEFRDAIRRLCLALPRQERADIPICGQVVR